MSWVGFPLLWTPAAFTLRCPARPLCCALEGVDWCPAPRADVAASFVWSLRVWYLYHDVVFSALLSSLKVSLDKVSG